MNIQLKVLKQLLPNKNNFIAFADIKETAKANNVPFPKFKKMVEVEGTKNKVKQELKQKAYKYINKNPIIDTIEFFGGEQWGERYKALLAGGKRKGFTEGSVPTVNGVAGWSVVTEAQLQKAIDEIFDSVTRGKYKLDMYLHALENAKTIKEIEAIAWEDKRSK